jgi:hypothetical protein
MSGQGEYDKIYNDQRGRRRAQVRNHESSIPGTLIRWEVSLKSLSS